MEWISEHGRSYGTMEEFTFRNAIFAAKDVLIEAHNAEGHSYTLGHNSRSDWTELEHKKLLGYKADSSLETKTFVQTANVGTNPVSVNWITAGAVNPVQDQG